MTENRACSSCGKEISSQDGWCKHCDACLDNKRFENQGKTSSSDDLPDLTWQLDDLSRTVSDDDFAELDYRPGRKKGCLIRSMVILIALSIVGFSVYLLIEDDPGLQPADDEEYENVEEEEEEESVIDPFEPDAEETEDEELKPENETEPERSERVSPDYDQLEAALFNWLINRIGDPHVIMLPAEEVDDVDQFYDRYNPDEETILVYKIESKDNEFVTVVLGPPFSEWLYKVVLLWEQSEWRVIREESLEEY